MGGKSHTVQFTIDENADINQESFELLTTSLFDTYASITFLSAALITPENRERLQKETGTIITDDLMGFYVIDHEGQFAIWPPVEFKKEFMTVTSMNHGFPGAEVAQEATVTWVAPVTWDTHPDDKSDFDKA